MPDDYYLTNSSQRESKQNENTEPKDQDKSNELPIQEDPKTKNCTQISVKSKNPPGSQSQSSEYGSEDLDLINKDWQLNKWEYKTQQILIWLTCHKDFNSKVLNNSFLKQIKGIPNMNNEFSGGICALCAMTCHKGHDLRDLNIKYRFKCECGNSKFLNKCLYKLGKKWIARTQYKNKICHNFMNKFWYWKTEYDPNGEDMSQCVIWLDWYHHKHLLHNFDKVLEFIHKRCHEQEDLEDNYRIICNFCTIQFQDWIEHNFMTDYNPKDPNDVCPHGDLIERVVQRSKTEHGRVQRYKTMRRKIYKCEMTFCDMVDPITEELHSVFK